MTDTLLNVPGIENLSPAARRATVDTANSLGTNPDFLATAFRFESNFNPKAINSFSGASGIIQFMPKKDSQGRRLPEAEKEAYGATIDEIRQMSQEAQIKGPVYQYLKGFKGRLNSVENLYLAIFFPAAIGQSDDFIVGDKNGTKFQQAVYNQNSKFDSQGTGFIRRADIIGAIRGLYNSAQARGRVDVPPSEFFRNVLLFGLAAVAAWGFVSWGTRGASDRYAKRVENKLSTKYHQLV